MNTELNFQLTPHETDIVMNCLAEQPYKTVAGVISKMVAQANSAHMQTPAQNPVDVPPAGETGPHD